MNVKIKHRFLGVLALGILLVILLLGLLIGNYFDLGIACPFKTYMNLECPGCGGTRMIIEILRFNWYQAFRYNPFLFVTFPFMGVIGIQQTIKFVLKGDFSLWLDKVLLTYAILLMTFGIIRNIGIFVWLKPTVI